MAAAKGSILFSEFALFDDRLLMMQQKRLCDEKLAILLCSYNGERFLAEQLDSFLAQTYSDWFLLVSDDKSSDATKDILTSYQNKYPAMQMEIVEGPGSGFVENFKFITKTAMNRASYYAWSDQDDLWLPDKLERAVSWLKTIPVDTPALYCGRTLLVTEDNRELVCSKLFTQSPDFKNALMQSIGGGNTMVFNQAACQLLVRASQNVSMVSHDWWAYIMVTAVGGRVYYDETPCLRYRQHVQNLVGSNVGWPASLARIFQLLQGRYKRWNDINTQALLQHEHLLTHENRETLQQFIQLRQQLMPQRLVGLKRSGLYRQTRLGNLGLIIAALFGKL